MKGDNNEIRENILCNSQDVLKICDFGSAKVIEASGKNTPYIVSRYYRAPELILCITNYSTAIDIWGSISLNLINNSMIGGFFILSVGVHFRGIGDSATTFPGGNRWGPTVCDL